MERAKKIVEELRRAKKPTEEEVLNVIREYLQVLVLKLIFQSKFGAVLSFMGGTCLRVCYDLKRYSEDLDFCLDAPSEIYRFSSLVSHLKRELELSGFSLMTSVQEEKVVQKAFLRFSGFAEHFELRSLRKDQKLHIKLEVDVHPPTLKKEERESFFVNRFGEIYPILKHEISTLFAGKVLALLGRPFTRGRDYYDLIWYLSRKTPLNFDYVNRGLKGKRFASEKEVFGALQKKVEEVSPSLILKDIRHFLEDPSEEAWIEKYQDLFRQLMHSRPESV
ncbi:MAG: hypothetical protein A3I05_09555 [Deltaproteobacteria bacterium RIFCSPLOWO2_02_FULL_44_10]|nr:MAG: hypothetical protein A3C46_00010 [Deltaproteobacteria bacterium RIFCSPHIGHO2_02_FULL_44_16]OGQ46813.1 MAG: hypothetical protein A3I05_09555 [Deltaproteobacteria bacterium RIFCSPLOWO2_02_FULL_44_10]